MTARVLIEVHLTTLGNYGILIINHKGSGWLSKNENGFVNDIVDAKSFEKKKEANDFLTEEKQKQIAVLWDRINPDLTYDLH